MQLFRYGWPGNLKRSINGLVGQGLLDNLSKGNPLGDIMEDVQHVIKFVREHGDDLVRLVQNTPTMLGEAGDGLVTAASAATNASGFLSGGDSPIHSLVDVASDAIATS